MTELQEIEHLDFDVVDEPKESCEGFTISNHGVVTEDNRTCRNAAKVMTVRSCCGVIERLCLGCYNRICNFHAHTQATAGGSSHNGTDSGHAVRGLPFSHVEFIK